MQLASVMRGEKLLDAILELSPTIRYAAVHVGAGEPLLRERAGGSVGTAADSERWDELVVNPVLIELAARRGDVDCDGLDYVLVRYRRFYNLVLPLERGHLSVVIEPDGEPLPLIPALREIARSHGASPRRDVIH